MSLRRAHGNGAKALVRYETPPPPELPLGVPGEIPADAGAASREGGRFEKGNTRSSLGGKAKKGKSRLAARLGLSKLPDDSVLKPYLASAATFRRTQCTYLAQTVGGSVCGPGPSSVVASAALALAWSRFFSDLAATTLDPEHATRAINFADRSRNMLGTAMELCAREAEARARSAPPVDPLARWMTPSAEEGK